MPARTGSRRRRLWICRFAWTTQTRCPHTHSRRKSSSRKLLELKDKGRRDHTLISAIPGPRSGVHFTKRTVKSRRYVRPNFPVLSSQENLRDSEGWHLRHVSESIDAVDVYEVGALPPRLWAISARYRQRSVGRAIEGPVCEPTTFYSLHIGDEMLASI